MFPENWSPNPFWNGWEFSPGQMTVVLYPVVVVTKIKSTPRSGPEPGVWQKRLICCEECPKLYYTSDDVKVHIMRVWYISVKNVTIILVFHKHYHYTLTQNMSVYHTNVINAIRFSYTNHICPVIKNPSMKFLVFQCKWLC